MLFNFMACEIKFMGPNILESLDISIVKCNIYREKEQTGIALMIYQHPCNHHQCQEVDFACT